MKQKKPVTGKEKDEAAKRRERQLKKSLHIAADICVYTNHNVIVEEI